MSEVKGAVKVVQLDEYAAVLGMLPGQFDYAAYCVKSGCVVLRLVCRTRNKNTHACEQQGVDAEIYGVNPEDTINALREYLRYVEDSYKEWKELLQKFKAGEVDFETVKWARVHADRALDDLKDRLLKDSGWLAYILGMDNLSGWHMRNSKLPDDCEHLREALRRFLD